MDESTDSTMSIEEFKDPDPDPWSELKGEKAVFSLLKKG